MMRYAMRVVFALLILGGLSSPVFADEDGANGEEEVRSQNEQTLGEVVEQREGRVIITLGEGDGVERGQRIEFFSLEEVDLGEGDATQREQQLAVGRVGSVGESRAEVELGINERVPTGAKARPTDEPLSFDRTVPPRMGGIWEFEFMARPYLALGTLGAGSVGHLRATHRFDSNVAIGLNVNPFSFGVAEEGNVFAMGGDVNVAYDTRVFSVGLGAGAFDLNQDDVMKEEDLQKVGFGLTQTARLGAKDGLHLSARNAFVLENREFAYGGTEGELQLPLDFLDVRGGSWAVARGGGYISGSYYGEVGLRVLVDGNGDSGSLFVTPTIGGAVVEESERIVCGSDVQEYEPEREVCHESRSYGGPMVGFGMEWRY